MDKKEKKRDVAVFANMMKDLMNQPLESNMTTLDRDIQHFIYGRVALLVKHNDGQPIGSIADVSTVVGAALADVLAEFTRNRVDDAKLLELYAQSRENLLQGFDVRSPKPVAQEPAEAATEEKVEA